MNKYITALMAVIATVPNTPVVYIPPNANKSVITPLDTPITIHFNNSMIDKIIHTLTVRFNGFFDSAIHSDKFVENDIIQGLIQVSHDYFLVSDILAEYSLNDVDKWIKYGLQAYLLHEIIQRHYKDVYFTVQSLQNYCILTTNEINKLLGFCYCNGKLKHYKINNIHFFCIE